MIQKKNKKNRKSICLGAQGRKKRDMIPFGVYISTFLECVENGFGQRKIKRKYLEIKQEY